MGKSQRTKWARSKLGDFFRIKHGFAFKGEYFAQTGSYVLLTPGNFHPDGGIKLKGEREKYYRGDFPQEFLLQKDDLLIVLTDLKQDAPILGSPAFVPESGKFLHNQRLGKIIDLDTDRLNCRFLYYLLNSHHVRAQIRATATGATVRHTAPERIYSVEVLVPNVLTQHKIATILSAYDDLIENNTRRIEVLDKMAQAIYREWFVHLRFPGHEKVKMVDSSLGKIPDGWAVVSIKDMYNTRSGGTPSRKNKEYYVGGTINWVKTKELDDRFIWDTEEKITALGLKRSSAKVLPPKTVLVAMYGANIGQLGILGNQASTNQACCAFLTRDNRYGYVYLYLLLRDRRDSIINLRLGAAQQNVSQEILRDLPIVKPPVELVEQFTELVESLFDLMEALQRKTANLRTSRDLLLPKLISGEVDVTDLGIGGGNAFT